MSILRAAALLAARAGCVAGPGLPAQLGALSALQHKLAGCTIQKQNSGWLQACGFAAGGGTGGGGGGGGEQQTPRPDAQPQQPPAAAGGGGEDGSDEHPAAASAQQAEQQAEAPAQPGGAVGSQQPSGPSIEQDPRLAKFVESLKQLKGGGRV